MHLELLKDGGFKSRKLIYGAGTSAMIFFSGLLAATKAPGLAPMLDTLVGGLMGTFALYLGANVGTKVTAQKAAKAAALVAPAEPEQSP